MAIQKNITDRFGVTHENAYAQINHIEIGDPCIINVLVYTNAVARSKGTPLSQKVPVLSLMYTIRTAEDRDAVLGDSVLKGDGMSPLTSIYTWLKTLNDSAYNEYSNMPSGIDWTTGTTDV